MEEQLREWRLRGHGFADPGAALAAVAAGTVAFDVAVLDQTMPGMSGLQLARALTGLLPDPRILLYTGYSDPISADECRDCYVIEVMHKPIDHAALHRLLRANLPA
jgi:DNA-binding NtrC family response regulator